MHGEIRNAYIILVEKPEGKRAFRRPRRRWEYNIENIKLFNYTPRRRLDVQEL
jgi:hypothetical protein